MACLQSFGTWLEVSDFWNMHANGSDSTWLNSFKTLGLSSSGPGALCGCKSFRSLKTPGAVIWMSGMEGMFDGGIGDRIFGDLDHQSVTLTFAISITNWWCSVLFSVRRDGKVSKPEANFRPPRMQKKTTWTLFSVLVDGNLSTHGAIFRPWRTENSLRCAYVSVPADRNLSTHGAISRPYLVSLDIECMGLW